MGNVTTKKKQRKPRELRDEVPGEPDLVLFGDATNDPIDQPIAVKDLAGTMTLVHPHKEAKGGLCVL